MPWIAKKTKSGASIIKPETGEVVGHSTSLAKAQASVRARYAAVGRKGEFFNKRKTGNHHAI